MARLENTSPLKALLVVTLTALVCSILVSAAAVFLQPIQKAYADLERIRVIVQLSGLLSGEGERSDLEIINAYRDLRPAVIDLESGAFDDGPDPEFLAGQEEEGLQQRVDIPPELDLASLGTRPRRVTVYLLEDDAGLVRMILPVYGQGMWSTIRGYLALDADLSTIADVMFYEHGETAGIGDRITQAPWLAGWRGKRLYDAEGQLRFSIGTASAAADAAASGFRVDGIAGATFTVNGVANLVRYWFGDHGYGAFRRRILGEGGA